jgi:hypothetical protein
MGRSTEDLPQLAADEAQARRVRRAELLMQRQRAAQQRRRRGFRLRPPSSQPLVFPDPPAEPTA